MGKHHKAYNYPIALQMRQNGSTYADISRALGIPKSSITNWFYEAPVRVDGTPGVCDCGNPATHLGVPLTFLMANDFPVTELYDLCDDCWQLEHEPIQTKGEAVWNR